MRTLSRRVIESQGAASDDDDGVSLTTDNAPTEFKSKKSKTKMCKKVVGTSLKKKPTQTLLSSSVRSKYDGQTAEQSAHQPPEDQDFNGIITLWQEHTSSELEPGQGGIIARLVQGSLDLFSSLVRSASDSTILPKKAKMALRRSLATLQLWADGHNILDGKLDRVLERSKSLQYTTLATLNALCETLVNKLSKIVLAHARELRLSLLRSSGAQVLYEQTKWILAEHNENDSDSGWDSDSSKDELDMNSVESVVGDIKTYTQCLVDLNAALECPATDPDHGEDEPIVSRLEKRSAYDYYADLIIAKYPRASPEVVECLGKANWDRYQRMQLERSNNLNASTADIAEQPISVAPRSLLADSEFQDSGLGTSIPAQQSTYAETVLSFISSISGGQHVRMPPLLAEAKNGAPFECGACGKNIKVTTNRAWRKHLFNDLRPYTCFHVGCNFSAQSFPDRQLWSAHLELDHNLGPGWESEQCPLCLEPTGAGKSVILIHFARHMEDIALTALPHDIGSEANSDADSNEESDASSKAESKAESDVEPSTSKRLTGAETISHMPNDPASVLNPTIDGNFCISCKRPLGSDGAQLWGAGDLLNTYVYCSQACQSAYWNDLNGINEHNGTPALMRGLPSPSEWKDFTSWDEGVFPINLEPPARPRSMMFYFDSDSMIAQKGEDEEYEAEDEDEAANPASKEPNARLLPQFSLATNVDELPGLGEAYPNYDNSPWNPEPAAMPMTHSNPLHQRDSTPLLHRATNPSPSPHRATSPTASETIVCDLDQCTTTFTGRSRIIFLARHKKREHGIVEKGYPAYGRREPVGEPVA